MFFWLKAVLTQDIHTVLYNTVNEFPTYQKLLQIFKILILFYSSSVLNYIVLSVVPLPFIDFVIVMLMNWVVKIFCSFTADVRRV